MFKCEALVKTANILLDTFLKSNSFGKGKSIVVLTDTPHFWSYKVTDVSSVSSLFLKPS